MSNTTNCQCPFMKETDQNSVKDCPFFQNADWSKANECPYLKTKCPHFQKTTCCNCKDCKCTDCKCSDDKCCCPSE